MEIKKKKEFSSLFIKQGPKRKEIFLSSLLFYPCKFLHKTIWNLVFRSDRKDWKANTHNQRLRKEFLRESVLVKRESHVHLRGKKENSSSWFRYSDNYLVRCLKYI